MSIAMNKQTRAPETDVVIPTRDRPHQLLVTLDALSRQSFAEFGVVIVDDGSRGDLESMIPPSLRDSLRIRLLRNEVSIGAGPARNRGAALSGAQYVVFMDDDCIAGPDLLRKHYEVLASATEPTVSLGPILSPAGHRPPVWSHWDSFQLDRLYARLARGEIAPDWWQFFTGNVALSRADFLAVGGFDERFARGEDAELGYRLGQRGLRFHFDSEALVYHDSQRSLRSWMRIQGATAISDIAMHEHDPESNRLEMVRDQMGSRHWALRLTRRIFGGPVTARIGAAGALSTGLVLHALRADRLSFLAISVVRDLTYWRSLRKQLAHLSESTRRAAIGVA